RGLPDDSQDSADEAQDEADEETARADDAEQTEEEDNNAPRNVLLRLHPQHHSSDQDDECEDNAHRTVNQGEASVGTDPNHEPAECGHEDHDCDRNQQDQDSSD